MIPRKDLNALVRQSKNNAISILIGARQVGKSTLLDMVKQQLAQPSETYNLENPLHLALFNEGYTSFIRQVRSKIVFIDEFQYCRDISSIFKAVHDLNPDIKIYASGSSSMEIQAHLRESLAGRKLEKILYPLSYAEWLLGEDPSLAAKAPFMDSSTVDELEAHRSYGANYIRFGGMPGLLSFQGELEKREYLFGIYQTYIAKDIKSFLRDESVLSFNKMISWLALNNGGQLNKSALSNIVGISSRQIERYLEVLQGTFVLALLPPLTNNKGKELSKTPKFYLYDQGIINSIIQDFRPLDARQDSGTMREQFVFWELKKNMDIRFSLNYWRTADGMEVDFVLQKDAELLPIEVKSAWKPGKLPSGLRSFLRLYPETKKAAVLYDGPEHTVSSGACTIQFSPLYKAQAILDW